MREELSGDMGNTIIWIFLALKFIIINNQMKKNSKNSTWCEEQDQLITEFVQKFGTKNWAKIAEQLDGHGYKRKTGKQCRERWHNHLDPNILKKGWSHLEEEVMFQEHKKYGNRWTLIATSLPGRTDNAIKNHFYSTIRRSLRRMNKSLGSKNSTMKMRKIKPSTLSKIFALAEGRPEQENPQNQDPDVPCGLQDTCREILGHLMEFAKLKPASSTSMDHDDIKNFEKVMEEMIKINDLYEDEKAKQAKQKRQRKLEKNFDGAVGSDEESDPEEEEDNMKSEEIDYSIPSEQIFRTRSNRKVKPPLHYFPVNPKSKKAEHPQNHEKEVKKTEFIPTTFNFDQQMLQQIQDIPQQEQDSLSNMEFKKSQFNLDLQENFLQIDNLGRSPNFRNTPFALTPTQGLFQKQFSYQPIKNGDCDAEVMKLIMRIQKNSQNLGSSYKEPKRSHNSFHSPSSAFRAYS